MARRPADLVAWLGEAGSSDPVLDGFLLAGPLVVAFVAVLGRAVVTEAVATCYVGGFAGYVVLRGLRRLRRAGGS